MHRALAREFLDVPEVGPGLGAVVAEFVLAVGDDLGEVDEADVVAVDQFLWHAIGLDHAVIERLEHAVALESLAGGKLLLGNVPRDLASRDLGSDILDAVGGVFLEGDAQFLGCRLQHGLAQCILKRSAPGGKCHGALLGHCISSQDRDAHDECRQQGSGPFDEWVDFHDCAHLYKGSGNALRAFERQVNSSKPSFRPSKLNFDNVF